MWARISDSVLSNIKYASVSSLARLLWFELCVLQAGSNGKIIPFVAASSRASSILAGGGVIPTNENICSILSELVSVKLGDSKNGLLIQSQNGFSINDFFEFNSVADFRKRDATDKRKAFLSRKEYESSLKSSLANSRNETNLAAKVASAMSEHCSITVETVHDPRTVNFLPHDGGSKDTHCPAEGIEIKHENEVPRGRPSDLNTETKNYLTSMAGASAAEAKSQTGSETSEVDRPKRVQRTPSGNLLPSSLEEALKVPIQERSEMVLNCDPFQISFLRPDQWPEVARVWKLSQTALEGDLEPAIGKFERDKGVQRIVERYSEGVTPELFEKVVCAIKRSDWWGDGSGKGPWVLTKTVFDKGLQQLSGKKIVSKDEEKRQRGLVQRSTRESELKFIAELRAKQKKD